jgi:N-acetylneuraminic acid mutarotase
MIKKTSNMFRLKKYKSAYFGNLIPTIILISSIAILSSCNDEEEVSELLGNWVERSDFEGIARSSAVAFTIGEYAYVGTGFNNSQDEYYADFWRYDAKLNFWQQIADLPGNSRSSAVAFSIDDKGYVGTGYDGDDELSDFWQYDPSSNSWTPKTDFAGSARRSAVGFSLDGKGYIGTGYDGNNLKDFWQYDPSSDSWTQIPSLGGSKRKDAFAFTIGNTAYVGGGSHNGSFERDFWALNAVDIDSEVFPWQQLADLDEDDDYYDILREDAAAFSIDNRGFIATGNSGFITSSVWEYNPGSDFWEEKTPFEGSSRVDAIAFTINNRAYLTAGRNGSAFYDDIWEFYPTEEYDEED